MSEHAIDFHDRSYECPHCGFSLFRGGFCIHYEPSGQVEGTYDGVPRGTGAALSATLDPANSQTQQRKDASHV